MSGKGGAEGKGLKDGAHSLGSPSAMTTPRSNQTCFQGVPRLMKDTRGAQKATGSGW